MSLSLRTIYFTLCGAIGALAALVTHGTIMMEKVGGKDES